MGPLRERLQALKGEGSRLDDMAGVAGGAFSVLAGLKAEAEALAKSRADAFAQKMELVRREEFDAAMELARRAREAAEALEERVAKLEARLTALEGPPAKD
ncbi:accessory factor UbiK family protein [Rhodovarius crocodyli]|uniref:Accessory factor UbiK family protein n=1 Tax=Rhodovarius crocodyli TaxID=1979269 RepID=A0A437MPI4_9PROT|nr:accessory factor UbiK family protein [Rhodovarius crocodyli]RVT99535.1 accessory factor UbiK family protein [Rhodovarius crocodyli]